MTEKPRQYFPGEYDPQNETAYQPPVDHGYENQTQQGYYAGDSGQGFTTGNGAQPGREDQRGQAQGNSNAWAGALGAIAALSLIAAGALFFLWRSAAAQANQEPPAPVTETVVQTQTVTETTTVTETRTVDSGEPVVPVPTEIQEGANSVRDFIDGLLNPEGPDQSGQQLEQQQ